MTEIIDDINESYQFSRPEGVLAPFIEFFSESLAKETVKPVDGQH